MDLTEQSPKMRNGGSPLTTRQPLSSIRAIAAPDTR